MTKVLSAVAGLASAATMILTPLAAYADKPLGMYQTEDRLEDYQLSLCGPKEVNLCVKLVALRGKAYSDHGAKLIGTNIIDQATPTGANKWKGSITLNDKTASGTASLRPGVALDLHACAYVVICASISLLAAK